MVDFTISVDEDVLETLRTIAEYRNVRIEDILCEMVLADIEGIKRRQHSPLVGLLDKYGDVEDDVASRADDILRSEWQPD